MSALDLLKQAKKHNTQVTKSFKDVDDSKERAIQAKQDKFKALDVESVKIMEMLSGLENLPLDYYYWDQSTGLYVVRNHSYSKTEIRMSGERAYRGISKDNHDGVFTLSFSLTYDSLEHCGIQITGTLVAGDVVIYNMKRSIFNKLEVKRGLEVRTGHAWKEPLNKPVETSHVGAVELVESLNKIMPTLINTEILEEMLTKSERKTILAKFLSTDEIELVDDKGSVGAKFKTADGCEFIVLSQDEKTAYFENLVNARVAKYFDVQIFAEKTGLELASSSQLNKTLSREAFEKVADLMLGKSTSYGVDYVKRHGFTDAFASFQNFSIVDCSKV